jgi:small subunit ribosomal protein S16
MSLRIRLRRMGRKKSPHYRIVVAESSMPRDGRFVEIVGHYNPTTNPATLVVDRDKALSWIGKGATATDTVNSLFKKAGVFKPAPTVVETVTDAVKETARKATKTVKAAATAVVEAVTEAVAPAADEAPAAEAEAPAAEAPAAEAPAAEAPTAEAEAPVADAATEEQAG